MFAGDIAPQQAADEHFQYAHMLRGTAHWQPDIATLRTATSRIVVGIGNDSAGQLCDRTSRALAAALATEPTVFPGDHVGFAEDPDSFATALCAVLRERCLVSSG